MVGNVVDVYKYGHKVTCSHQETALFSLPWNQGWPCDVLWSTEGDELAVYNLRILEAFSFIL